MSRGMVALFVGLPAAGAWLWAIWRLLCYEAEHAAWREPIEIPARPAEPAGKAA